MSKFEELCQSYKISLDKYNIFHKESIEFAKTLYSSYKKYLEILTTEVRIIPAIEADDEKKTYFLERSLHLDDTTYWN